MSLTVGTASGNKDATGITIGTASGNKAVSEGWVGTASGNKRFYSSLSASASGQDVWGAVEGSYLAPFSCDVDGGIGPYTYSWEIVAGGEGVTLNGATSADASVSTTEDPPPSTTVQCTVTDSQAVVAVSNEFVIDGVG